MARESDTVRFGRFSSSFSSVPLAKLVTPNRWTKIVFGPMRADHVAQRLVEAADERGHPDDRRDADHDAEDGQPRAHLVRAHGVERHRDDFAEEAETDGHVA